MSDLPRPHWPFESFEELQVTYVPVVGAVICLITAVFAVLAWRAAARHAVGGVDPAVGRRLQSVQTTVESVAGSLREEHDRLRTAQMQSVSELRSSQSGELGALRQEVQGQIAGVQELLLRSTSESGAALSAFTERSVERFDQAQEKMSGRQATALQSLSETVAGQIKQLTDRSDALRAEIGEAARLAREDQAQQFSQIRQDLQLEQQRAAAAGKTLGDDLASSQKSALEELRVSLTERVSELTRRGEEARLQQANDLRLAGEQTTSALTGFREELTATTTTQREELVRQLAEFRTELGRTGRQLREESTQTREKSEQTSRETAESLATSQRAALGDLQQNVVERLTELTTAMSQEQQAARNDLQTNLKNLNNSNERRLEDMRKTVQEKLDATLGERLDASFKQVSSQLESVHKGLGEMQNLAQGVGSLHRTLTNVKTRGAWAELHLEALLADVMTPDQYRRQWKVVPDSNELVDCAIRLPGAEDGEPVWLPIDAKFPTSSYERLLTAHEAGESAGIDAAKKAFLLDIKREAQSISTKYVRPPHTTDFAVMYLATEGLFAEVVREPGLVQWLRNEQHIVVAGPTTLTALLGSMSMGFRTLAIQQRSSEVWRVLGQVKSEFEKSGQVWVRLEKQLATAGRTAHEAGTRHRKIAQRLRAVETVDSAGSELEGTLTASLEQEWDEVHVLNPPAILETVTTLPASPQEEDEPARIRQWARENGYPVAERGRLGIDIVNAYRASITAEAV